MALDSANLGAGEKSSAIDAAADIIAAWKQGDVNKLEIRIIALSDVDALRTIAFFSRGALFPQNAEDVDVDAKLERMFWASVRSLQKEESKEANDALRIIERSNLLQGGDLLRFREFSEQAKRDRKRKEE